MAGGSLPAIEPGAGRHGRRARLAGVLVLGLVAALLAGAIWLYARLRSSLPRLDGVVAVAGLGGEVTLERDALGVPTISGSSRADVAHGLGFAHGQDRFFQMDLLRRQSAGELAELFGETAAAVDRRHRVHRFRSRAAAVLAATPAADRAILDGYVAGVNDGLASIGGSSWEYLLLGVEPRPWAAEDTILAVHTMYFQLNDETAARESTRGLIRDLLGQAVFDFLAPLGDSWDAPIFGQPYGPVPIPGPDSLDLRRAAAAGPAPDAAAWIDRSPAAAAGSNSWAVAGELTAHGGALLANDMHLPLRLPQVWYRASLRYRDAAGGERRITGVSLPGTPSVVVGSNGKVAWGFTNTYGDWGDLVLLEPDPEDPDGAYLTADGPRAFARHRETVRVKGGDDQTIEVLETVWGPVLDTDHRGRRRALRWTAHDPPAVRFELLRLEAASDVEQAVEAANRAGAPPQNFVVADAGGRIAWTVLGPIPRRFGHDGRVPSSWAAGDRGWDGYLDPGEYPRVFDPPSGRLWTANGRVASGEMMARIGLGTYAQGGRASQIRDRLLELEGASEADMLAIQLDDEARFLGRWRELLLEVLTDQAAADPRRAELRRLVEDWGGRAAVDSAGYRMVRAYRLFVAERLFEAITARCKQADERFDFFRLPLYEGPLWQLVSERPQHLVPATWPDWDELLLATADETIDHFTAGGAVLSARTWGERNTVRIRHPFSQGMPLLSRWLDMPATPLPGDSHMPRFQSAREGASERLAVSPGREAEGYFHMPGGQSGHPLSPHYGDSHGAWVRGEPTPFLPGPALHTLTLRPAGR